MSSSVGQLVPQATMKPLNTTTTNNGPQIEGSYCTWVNYTYDPVIAVVCGMYMTFGIVYTLFGYRCFKVSMFLTGFTFGSAVIYLICQQEYLMPPYGNISVSIAAGLMFGLITMLIQYVGLFMTGFHTGLLLAVVGLTTYSHYMSNEPKALWLCTSVLLGSGIHFAVLNLYWKKALTIFGTAVYGSAVITICLDYFFEKMAMVNWMWERTVLITPTSWPCRFSFLLLVAWLSFTFIGFVTQCAFTGKQIHHQQSIRAQKRRLKGQVPRLTTREQRAEMKQRKYRYLYQVRTAHGDVISQSYVQALQKRVQCNSVTSDSVGNRNSEYGRAGECSTLQSDSTHLTILAGSEQADAGGALMESDEELPHLMHNQHRPQRR